VFDCPRQIKGQCGGGGQRTPPPRWPPPLLLVAAAASGAFDLSVTLRNGQHATGGVTTTTYIPTLRVLPNATCALHRRPLPANACLARPHESSQTDVIG